MLCSVLRARDNGAQSRALPPSEGGSAAYRGRGEGLRVAVGDGQLLAGDRRLVAGCRVRYRDVATSLVSAACSRRSANRTGARTMSSASFKLLSTAQTSMAL